MECQFCHGGVELEKVCGKLHSVVNEICHCVAHHKCMQYSSNLEQFKSICFGGFIIEKVEKEIKRGQKLKCSVCKRKGATAGCAFKYCKRTYHYPCARKVRDIRVCRLVKYASQDVDPKSTVVVFCLFCSAAHQDIFTENMSLASVDELSSNSEDDVGHGTTEVLPRCTADVDLFEQRLLSPSSPDNNMNMHSEHVNQVDRSNYVIGDIHFPLPVDINKNSVDTSSAIEKNAVGNISSLGADVSGTPSLAAHHVSQNAMDATPRSDCRRDRLCLKSSQRKRKARQVEHENAEASQFKPLLEDKELQDRCLNWNESNKCAKIDTSAETRTEATGVSKSSADPVNGVSNGHVDAFDHDFLPCLDDIPDPLADQVTLKQPRNLPDICVSSSRTKNQKKLNPGCSQTLITSFLTPKKKLGMTVAENWTTEESEVAKEKPKAQKPLKVSGTNAKSNENVKQLIFEAEKCQVGFKPFPLDIFPIDQMNVSPIEDMNILPIAATNVSPTEEMTLSPVAEIVSAAKEANVSPDEGATVPSKTSGISELDLSPQTLKENLPNASRKLLLDGRGNFASLPENKSLHDSLSESSNDARGSSTESNDIYFNDLGGDSTSTAVSPSYEELSSTFFLHQPEENTDIDQVCGLCIPVIKEPLDDRTSKALLKYAICNLDLVEENVFSWQIVGLNEIQILSIVLQFSRYLRDQKELELVKQLSEPKRFDVNCFVDNKESVIEFNVETIQQEIKQNFSSAEKKYRRSVGQLCSIQDLNISVAFIILSSANDSSTTARSSLPKIHRVHECSEGTKFVISHNFSDTQRTIIFDNEYENLKWWLKTFDYSTVLSYPTENILQSSNSSSVTNRLKHSFTRRIAPGGDTSFIFIQRTNPDLLTYRPFVCKMLAFVKEELLTCNHDACIVFDVGQDLGIKRFADVVMPCLSSDPGNGDGYCFEVEAFSGTNPMYSPVSCLVIRLLLRFS